MVKSSHPVSTILLIFGQIETVLVDLVFGDVRRSAVPDLVEGKSDNFLYALADIFQTFCDGLCLLDRNVFRQPPRPIDAMAANFVDHQSSRISPVSLGFPNHVSIP